MDSFHKKPSLFEHSQSFNLFGETLNFFLDTNKRGDVESLYFEYPGSLEIQEELEIFCKAIIGSPVGNIPEEISKTKFPLIPLLYRKFIMDVKEDHISFAEQKGRNPEKLVCRCFGVYEEDIHELVGKGIEVSSLRDLGDHLNAGVGCGTCHHDLKEVLNPLLSHPIKDDFKEVAPLWQKLDPQGLANEVFQILKNLNDTSEGRYNLKIKGTRPGGVLIGCESKTEITKEEITEIVQNKVDEALGKGLECLISLTSL